MPNGDDQQTPIERLYQLKMEAIQALEEGIDNRTDIFTDANGNEVTINVFDEWLNALRAEYQAIENVSWALRRRGGGKSISEMRKAAQPYVITEKDKKDFAQWLFYNVPEGIVYDDYRNKIRKDWGGEKVVPWTSLELYPDVDLEPIRQAIYEGDIVEASRLASAGPGDPMWMKGNQNLREFIALLQREAKEIETMTEGERIAAAEGAEPFVDPYGRGKMFNVHDWYQKADAEFQNEYKIDPDFPTQMDPKFAIKSSDYEKGKDLQWGYYKTNNPVYGLFSNDRKQIANEIHERGRWQYDIDKAMNEVREQADPKYKNPMKTTTYMNYVDGLIYGRRHLYNQEEMQKASEFITNQMAGELKEVNIKTVVQKQAGEPIAGVIETPASIAATQMIRSPDQAIDWIVAKESMNYSIAHRQGAKEILRNRLKTYQMANFGPELTSVAKGEDTTSMNAQMGRRMWNSYTASNYDAADMLGFKRLEK